MITIYYYDTENKPKWQEIFKGQTKYLKLFIIYSKLSYRNDYDLKIKLSEDMTWLKNQ